ncbi:MAG: PqqD family peptide modification chaperone [Desulfurococcaceae archaeon]
MNSGEEIDIRNLWEEYRNKKPFRQGYFIGEESGKFYVAKNEEEVYELSPLVYYIWLISDGEHTLEQLADQMCKDINVELDQVVEPLVLAINSLNKVELVKFV